MEKEKRTKAIIISLAIAIPILFLFSMFLLIPTVARLRENGTFGGPVFRKDTLEKKVYGTLAKGPRYLELTDGYITNVALDENDEIIGYKYVNFGKMMDFIKNGDDPATALQKASGQYGRIADAVRLVDPRKE